MKKEHWMDRGVGGGNNRNLLRIGVVFLAIVSFFTTANGMKKYIFVNDGVVAYSASAAIQGILLALSMNLPGYLKEMWSQTGQKPEGVFDYIKIGVGFIPKCLLSVCVIFLTLVTIFCSTWFSYVFIADTIHKDSWGTDSELLVQQTYRTELYDARDYAHAYRVYLEEKLGENILLLEEQARKIRDTVADFSINGEEEREHYAPDTETMAGSYMSVVINAMELALGKDDSQENRDLAAIAVTDARTNIADRMDSIQENLSMLKEQFDNYYNQSESLTNLINRATEGTDITALTNSVNNCNRRMAEITEQQNALQSEHRQLDSVLQRLPYYESQLGLNSSTSSISIRSKLMLLQAEIFQQEPNEEQILDIATEIFEDLRKASSTISGDESVEDSSYYTNMLLQMNRLIRNLADYSDVKDIETSLEEAIDDLRRAEGISTITEEALNSESESGSEEMGEPDEEEKAGESAEQGEEENSGEEAGTDEAGDSEEPEGEVEPEEEVEPERAEESDMENEPGEQNIGGEAGESGMDENLWKSGDAEATGETEEGGETGSADASDVQNAESGNSEQWKEEWNERLVKLKSQISAMPIYSGSEEMEEGMVSVLSEDQVNILHNYDRNNSSKELDEMVRRYISEHNAIYQGIIYLQSPYRSLALFALMLALSFDLSGFIFGFVKQNDNKETVKPELKNLDLNSDSMDSEQEETQFPESNIKNSKASDSAADVQAGWGIIKTLKPYLVLTGDYESTDGIYYYKTFKDGVAYRWVVKDTVPYGQGIYISQEIENQYSKGERQCPDDDQNVLFSHQAEQPQDGIYQECCLIFDEGSLILKRNNQQTFIANIDEYVPVHVYSPSQGQNRTFPAKQLSERVYKAQIAVVALNDRGTRVAAIYMIQGENILSPGMLRPTGSESAGTVGTQYPTGHPENCLSEKKEEKV